MAFSCGARSAFKLKEQGYLRSMLSRRQLQGFVRRSTAAHTNWMLLQLGTAFQLKIDLRQLRRRWRLGVRLA